jgi:hypothetical protein
MFMMVVMIMMMMMMMICLSVSGVAVGEFILHFFVFLPCSCIYIQHSDTKALPWR